MDPLKRQLTNDNALRVMLAWEELRKLDREIPGQVVSMFFYIASHNPCHKQAIEEDLEFTVASASRNLQWLTDTNRLGKPGLGLIEKYTEAGSRRIVCRLSHKGKQFVDNFLSVIYD